MILCGRLLVFTVEKPRRRLQFTCCKSRANQLVEHSRGFFFFFGNPTKYYVYSASTGVSPSPPLPQGTVLGPISFRFFTGGSTVPDSPVCDAILWLELKSETFPCKWLALRQADSKWTLMPPMDTRCSLVVRGQPTCQKKITTDLLRLHSVKQRIPFSSLGYSQDSIWPSLVRRSNRPYRASRACLSEAWARLPDQPNRWSHVWPLVKPEGPLGRRLHLTSVCLKETGSWDCMSPRNNLKL